MNNKRDLNRDLKLLLDDFYVWNHIAEEGEKTRLLLINKLANLAGDLLNGGPWMYNGNSKFDKMQDCTQNLADLSADMLDDIERQEDETV